MDYNKIGEKIRFIRKTELKLTREEFAEELDVSPITIARLENANSKITNIEIYFNISCITGYTLEELVDDNKLLNKDIKNKLDTLLNNLSNNELEYIYTYTRTFMKFLNNRKVDFHE